jgi:hypothetical protein
MRFEGGVSGGTGDYPAILFAIALLSEEAVVYTKNENIG